MGDEEVPGHGASQSEPFRDCSKLTNPEAADPKGQKKVRKNLDATSFFSTLNEELIYRHAWPTRARLKEELEDYIDGFYNSERRHSAAGRMSPVEYERGCMRAAA